MKKTMVILILAILSLGSCTAKNTDNQQKITGTWEDDVSSNNETTEEQDGLLLDDISYNDKYGNLVYQYDKRQKITYTLLYKPDIDFLLEKKDNLITLTINSKQITDISFLKNLPQLKELLILESNISSLEPVKYLDNLETLYIASGFPKIIDCSIFRNLENLENLDFGNNELENIGAIYYTALGWSVDKVKGLREYREKFRNTDDSKSNVFHYDKYHILQNGAKVRARPAENSDIIAELSLNDEIQILENTEKEEKINDVWGYWYKIKHNNITGYAFGGYIADKTLITDIDKNGTNDYLHLRYSTKNPWSERGIIPDKDVFIYINKQRINTNFSGNCSESSFDNCSFKERENNVFITFINYGEIDTWYTCKVLPDGKIDYSGNWDEYD